MTTARPGSILATPERKFSPIDVFSLAQVQGDPNDPVNQFISKWNLDSGASNMLRNLSSPTHFRHRLKMLGAKTLSKTCAVHMPSFLLFTYSVVSFSSLHSPHCHCRGVGCHALAEVLDAFAQALPHKHQIRAI